MAHFDPEGVRRMRGGGENTDDEEGPNADLTVAILAKHERMLRQKDAGSADLDLATLDVARTETKALTTRKKRGALDRLEKRERSRSSTPVQDSDCDSPARKKRNRNISQGVGLVAVEHEAEVVSRGFREGSSEEDGQIMDQGWEQSLESPAVAFSAELDDFGNGKQLESLDLKGPESATLRMRKKMNRAGPTLEAPDSSPPRDLGADGIPVPSGDNLTVSSLLRGRRYWDPPEDNEQRCFNCGATGHKAWTCPEPKKERPCFVCGKFGHLGQRCPTGKLCFVCGKGGHEARDCPKKGMRRGAGWASGEGQEGDVCYKCGWEGHTRAECWHDYDEADLQLIRCYICGQHGHLSCVDVVENGPKEVTCYQCGQAGHTGDGCARGGRGGFERDDGGPTCYRCGEKGHIARGCSKQKSYSRGQSYYDRDTYRGGYNDRYDPDQAYNDLDESAYDYVQNSRGQDGNEGLWLGGGHHAGPSRRDLSRYESRFQDGVSKGTNKYGNRRHSDGYGYESRRHGNVEDGYHGYNEDDKGRSKSPGRWRETREEDDRRWRGGGQGYQESNRSSYSAGHKRKRY